MLVQHFLYIVTSFECNAVHFSVDAIAIRQDESHTSWLYLQPPTAHVQSISQSIINFYSVVK